MAKREQTPTEDLNLNSIVSRQFDKAAATLKLPEGRQNRLISGDGSE
ncbi:MAG: hypothetical protein ACE5OR_08590 [bacterium]